MRWLTEMAHGARGALASQLVGQKRDQRLTVYPLILKMGQDLDQGMSRTSCLLSA